MRSLSEIETTSKRASRAVGFSWGIAEEIGKGIRLLEMFGFAGIKSLNQYYNSKIGEKFENLALIKENNISNKYSYCPIMLGINFLDQVQNLEKFEKLKFNKISFPILILPFLSRSSEIIGKKIYVKFDKIKLLLNLNVNISSNLIDKDYPIISENVEIGFVENKDSFTEQEWKKLYKLSEETFVEESDSLKQGAAGAGLTDND
tara:strand:- start:798 stop:1409 length:612 start_codon:yes stop_codon:yes gene_type:complete